MTDALLSHLRSAPVLDADTERDLAHRAKAGDADARRKLIEGAFRPLAWFVLKCMRARGGLAMEEIIAAGVEGFGRAVDHFDPDRGSRFSSYAMFWAKHHIRDAVTRSRSIVRPMHRVKKSDSRSDHGPERVYREVRDVEMLEGGEAERIAHLRARLGCSQKSAERAYREAQRRSDASLDAVLPGTESLTKLDFLASPDLGPEALLEEAQERREARRKVERALAVLTLRERDIVRVRLMVDEPETLEQVGQRYGLTRERIRQIQELAMKKMGAVFGVCEAPRLKPGRPKQVAA